jgi:beta-lactam-binding protein with PASTA domain
MRTCQSCGLQNPPDRDFCECGEYLRWEPTGYVQAVTPEMVAQAAAEAGPANPAAPADEAAAPAQPAPAQPPQEPPAAAAPPPAAPPPAPPPQVNEAAPPAAPPGNGHGSALTSGDPLGGSTTPPPAPPPQPPAVTPKTAVQQAVPTPPPAPQQAQEPAEPDRATITLRLPDQEADKSRRLEIEIEPGQRDRVLALIRNQSGIVDNYQLRIDGVPADWWSIYPDTVYLVPFGTGGTYEQEVEVHLHPPRTPDAEARMWDLQLVAHSKAHEVTAASAPLGLEVSPYTETSTALRPQRGKGRRKASYDVAVENKANAPVLVALEGEDPDGELQFGFNRPPQEIPPGQTVQTSMQVKPPKQIWIGRPQEKRFTVNTLTGEAAEERLAEEPIAADQLDQTAAPQKRGLFRRRGGGVPGVYGPKVYKPQVYPPGMNIGPGGISIRKPTFRGPQMQGPQMGSVNLDANKVQGKLGGLKKGGGSPAPTAPLLPSQGVFRQKAWLPWWAIPVAVALAALAVMLYLLLPKNVAVPDVVGSESAFAAEKELIEAGMVLDASPKEKVDPDSPPGSVVGQTPAAGTKAEKGSAVTIEIAIGDGKISVPSVTGMTLADAEAALRDKKLSLGQSSPQPPDPEGTIESQIPAADEIVKEGAPVDVFFADPNGKGKGKAEDAKAGGAGAAGAAGGEGEGGEDAEIIIPAIEGAPLDEFAQKLADDGLVPEAKRVFSEEKLNTLFATEPPGGTTVKAGTKVQLLVSAGFPQLAFDDDKNILLVNGANGRRLDPIAKSSAKEKDPAWSPDGTRMAYTGNGRVFLKNLEDKEEPAIALTGPDETFSDLAWAPTADLNLLAMSRLKGEDRDLCLGQITGDGMTTQCIADDSFQIGTTIRWSNDGKTILGLGVKALGEFGIVRYRSKKAFSPEAGDWGKGRIVTDTSKTNEGVIDAALSPDGRRLALVSNQGGGPFQLYLTEAKDFLLTNPRETNVRACKAAWRSDGRELVVVQADEICREDVGELVRLPVNDPRSQEQLNAAGDNPVFQPLTLGQ